MKFLVTALMLLGTMQSSISQTFYGTIGTIPDNSPPVYFQNYATGLPAVTDSSFGIESVCISISHNNLYQLTVQLIAPDSTIIDLSMNNGGTGNNYLATCFNQSASTHITAGNPPFTGVFRPQGWLGNANNGQDPNGLWQLKIQDQNSPSTGTLNSWNIIFGSNPSLPNIFTSSDLPLVLINTNGVAIPDDPKIPAQLGIIDNGPGVRNYLTDTLTFSSTIGIELRGSWSQSFPQKQYGFETWDSLLNEIDTTVMEMPAESDWILNAPWNDKTCMRNVLVYDLANSMGHYASRSRFCEVLLNNDYKGIYIMLEKIKRNQNRVDISKLTPADTTGDDLTGGYIFKIDKSTGSGGSGWSSNYIGTGTPIEFQYEYPSETDIMPQQKDYIQSFVDSFEYALAAPWFADPDSGYSRFIDVPSFVDFFLLNEFCKNVDAYRISTFLYKQKITKGGKLVVGPVWDYNIAFRNADYCGGDQFTGWQYQFNNICGNPGDLNVPFWWGRLLQDPVFSALVKCRWEELRLTTLHVDSVWNRIDSMALLLDEAKERHFNKWPILGVQTWANPSPIPADYAGEISSMKGWILNRLNWLDANMPGACIVASVNETSRESGVYPNPFTDLLHINVPEGAYNVQVRDIAGRSVLKGIIKSGHAVFDTANLIPGIYIVEAQSADKRFIYKVIRN
jgi:subtilisin-like proprotein convertase family protein